MTPLRLLEVFCSLTLQVALLVLATGWLARTVCRDVRDRDRLWSGCLLALLLLLVYDLCLPHLRLLPVPASVVGPSLLMQFEAQAGATWWLFGLWAAGALVMLGRLVVDSLRALWLLHQSVAIARERLPAPWGRLSVPTVTSDQARAIQNRRKRSIWREFDSSRPRKILALSVGSFSVRRSSCPTSCSRFRAKRSRP